MEIDYRIAVGHSNRRLKNDGGRTPDEREHWGGPYGTGSVRNRPITYLIVFLVAHESVESGSPPPSDCYERGDPTFGIADFP